MNNFEERPRKVHLFHDWKGETYKSCGSVRPYANTECRGNFAGPELRTTRNPAEVTCEICKRKIYTMGRKRNRDRGKIPPRPFIPHIPPEVLQKAVDEMGRATRQMVERLQRVRPPADPSVHKLLDQEIEHADYMAEMLRYVFRQLEDADHHMIAVAGTQITVGQLVAGALATHEKRREVDEG